MDKHKANEIIISNAFDLKCTKEVMEIAEKDIEMLNSIYKELCECIGLDATLKIYDLLKGQQITFPTHFYSSAKIHQSLIKEYDGTNIRKLANKYGYSEKTIRRLLKSPYKE